MKPSKKLRLALKSNAFFSGLSGIALILFHQSISTYMNLASGTVLWIIGAGLLLFVLSLWKNATRPDLSPAQIRLIIWQDWAWVIGSVAIILFQAFNINFAGYILIGVVALIVADFAILQSIFLRQLTNVG